MAVAALVSITTVFGLDMGQMSSVKHTGEPSRGNGSSGSKTKGDLSGE